MGWRKVLTAWLGPHGPLHSQARSSGLCSCLTSQDTVGSECSPWISSFTPTLWYTGAPFMSPDWKPDTLSWTATRLDEGWPLSWEGVFSGRGLSCGSPGGRWVLLHLYLGVG